VQVVVPKNEGVVGQIQRYAALAGSFVVVFAVKVLNIVIAYNIAPYGIVSG